MRHCSDSKDNLWAFVFGFRTGHIWALSQLSLCTYDPDRSLTNYLVRGRQFTCKFFPEWPLNLHDSPSNLAESRYPPHGHGCGKCSSEIEGYLTWQSLQSAREHCDGADGARHAHEFYFSVQISYNPLHLYEIPTEILLKIKLFQPKLANP